MRNNYNQAVRQRFDAPKFVGVFSDLHETTRVGRGQAGIPGRTNVVNFSIRADADNNIAAVKYQVYGCGVAIACCEWVAETITNMPLQQALDLPVQDIIDALAIDTMKHHCAVLVKEAMEQAVLALMN